MWESDWDFPTRLAPNLDLEHQLPAQSRL